jgi:hypothetical protein
MNILIKIVTVTLFLYLVYCGFLFVMQRQMLFPRYLVQLPYHTENTSGLEKIWVTTSFGKIETWVLPTKKNITQTFICAYDMLVARPDVDPSRIVSQSMPSLR